MDLVRDGLDRRSGRRRNTGSISEEDRTGRRVVPGERRAERFFNRLLGHLPEWIGYENATRVLERMLTYAEACGPVARVSLGPARMVVMSEASVAAAALADPRANYKGASYVLTRAVLDNVLLHNGETWEKNRATYRKALKGVDPLAVARAATADFAASLRPGQELALDRAINRLVGDIVGRFVAGVTLDDAFEPHRERIQYELAAVGIDLLCQPWTYLDARRWTRMRASLREARAFFRAAVDRRLAQPSDAPDVLNGFLALARAGAYPDDPAALTDGVVNFFFTAHDVLASSTAWVLHLLARHGDAQAELRAVLASRGGDAALERVVKEGLRLFPGYSLFGRTTRAEMEVGGYAVPRGTILITSPFVTHRLERYWPRAHVFDPDRWRERPPGTPPAAARDHFLPFGSGARACLASHLAFPTIETIVREIVTRVSLEADPSHEPGLSYWGTAYARNGMPAWVGPREVERAVPASA